MTWLNYHHLLYFWTVAREGTVVAAGKKLRLAPSTISDQIRQLEHSLDVQLFQRVGRTLMLTEAGELASRYAEEIFGRGQELVEALSGSAISHGQPLRVGLSDALPKLVAWRLLTPVLELDEPVRMVCREDHPDRLVAELAQHRLDVVLTDSPLPPASAIRAYNHLLGDSSVSLFGTRALVRRWAKAPPGSLQGAPFLLPTAGTALRRALDQWFEAEAIRPKVVAEFEDSALLKVFGQYGQGLFAAPTVVSDEITRQYKVALAFGLGELREQFYAITAERRIRHPGVVALSRSAREQIFSSR